MVLTQKTTIQSIIKKYLKRRISAKYQVKPFSNRKQSQYQQNKLKKQFRRRAAIEPINGHLKTDHRLNRNFYKEITGDNINVMLAAAAFNFKRMMNKWKSSFCVLLENYFCLVNLIAKFKNKTLFEIKLSF